MTIDDQIKDEKLQYDINREAAKILASLSGKLINMNIFQVKRCYLIIKNKQQNRLNLLILHWEKLLKNN